MPWWVTPLEATSALSMLLFKPPLYANMLDSDGVLNLLQQPQQEGFSLNWWHYNQIMSRYSSDKNIRLLFNAFDIILNAGG